MIKLSNEFKKNMFLAPFWSIFPIFWAKNFFLENPTLSHTSSNGSLTSCQNLEKTNDAIPRRKDRRMNQRTGGRMDRPYFIGLFRLLPGVQ